MRTAPTCTATAPSRGYSPLGQLKSTVSPPSCPRLSRAYRLGGHGPVTVMAGLSRPKDGVLSHAYVPAIHVFLLLGREDVDARDKRGHDRVITRHDGQEARQRTSYHVPLIPA